MRADSGYFWVSMDSLEQIVIGNGEILLCNCKTEESTVIGTTISEAINRLQDLGKADNFPDFMNDHDVEPSF